MCQGGCRLGLSGGSHKPFTKGTRGCVPSFRRYGRQNALLCVREGFLRQPVTLKGKMWRVHDKISVCNDLGWEQKAMSRYENILSATYLLIFSESSLVCSRAWCNLHTAAFGHWHSSKCGLFLDLQGNINAINGQPDRYDSLVRLGDLYPLNWPFHRPFHWWGSWEQDISRIMLSVRMPSEQQRHWYSMIDKLL